MMNTGLTRRTLLGLVAAGSIGIGGLAVVQAQAAGPASLPAAAARQRAAARSQMIDVTLKPWLATHSLSKQRQVRVAFHPGITPREIARAQGFQDADLNSVMVIVDGVQADLTAPLSGGEHVELMTGMAGG